MNQLTTKDFFKQESVQGKFKELLAERSTQFITTVLQIVKDRKSTRLNSSHEWISRMPSSA